MEQLIVPVFIVWLVTNGLWVKQASFILMKGSIFQGLRDRIDAGAKRENLKLTSITRAWYLFWFNLFDCKLCMTTQVGIWTVGLPTAVGAHLRWPHPFEMLLRTTLAWPLEALLFLMSGFMIGVASGAVGYAFWKVLEFPDAFTRALYRGLKQHAVANPAAQQTPILPAPSTNGEFTTVTSEALEHLKRSLNACKLIQCPTRRSDCKQDVKITWLHRFSAHDRRRLETARAWTALRDATESKPDSEWWQGAVATLREEHIVITIG